jgi:hypothetical protein
VKDASLRLVPHWKTTGFPSWLRLLGGALVGLAVLRQRFRDSVDFFQAACQERAGRSGLFYRCIGCVLPRSRFVRTLEIPTRERTAVHPYSFAWRLQPLAP